MNEEQVLEFASQAKFVITPENLLSRCVDGRYQDMENFPAVAKPGGDAGDVLVAAGAINQLELDLPMSDIIESVAEVVGGLNKFCFHTDKHAQHDNQPAGMGCGHIKLAKNNAQKYLVNQDQVDYLFEQLPEIINQGGHQVVLEGDHKESAVVVVSSDLFSIRPLLQTGSGLQEVFVYQQSIHQKQLERLSKVLQEKLAGHGIVSEQVDIAKALDDVFAVQLKNTLEALASGLPVYIVNFDQQGNPELVV